MKAAFFFSSFYFEMLTKNYIIVVVMLSVCTWSDSERVEKSYVTIEVCNGLYSVHTNVHYKTKSQPQT